MAFCFDVFTWDTSRQACAQCRLAVCGSSEGLPCEDSSEKPLALRVCCEGLPIEASR